jgi:glutaminase
MSSTTNSLDIQEVIEEIYDYFKNFKVKGAKNADYIPELKKVNPNLFSISIYTVDGKSYNVGDYNKEVAIESASKVFSLALAVNTFGTTYVRHKIGSEQTSEKFNSTCAIENSPTHTQNSFENGGAMATTSLFYEKNQKNFEKKIIDNMSLYAGRKLAYSPSIYKSEITHSDHNKAIGYLLESYGRFYGDVLQTLDVYTKQCSVLVTTKDVAIMAATLANHGINPKTGNKVLDKKNIPYILSHMTTNGLYEFSETWLTEVGLPAKSGVGGILLVVVPGKMGIGILSPPLDTHGNSAKGYYVAAAISKVLNLGIFR